MSYDVFISYRRSTGVDDARLLQQALKARGYEVFFDYDSLRDGLFNEKIDAAIDEAPVFILMMTSGALERCADKGDWVRHEIERALAKGRIIVPIAPSSQTWAFPESLPSSLATIPNTQVSDLNKTSLFEESIDKIVENRFPLELQRKRRTVGFIPSTVASPSPVFVGRDDELSRLHELLAAGKFPIITGPGGTGKSELARQYASHFMAEYPGGLFQIDMETALNWDVALLEKLLNPSSAPGYDVRGILKPQQKKNSGGQDIQLSVDDIVAALNRRVQSDGRMLLLLDNVESTKAFLRETSLAKLALQPDIRILATARTSDIAFRPSDKCVEFPLGDLSAAAAIDLLLQDHPVNSDTERAAAGAIAEMLGFRVLYLRTIPALLDDIYSPYGGSYAELSEALREKLLETVDDGMIYSCDAERTPSSLWSMTQTSLASHPQGAAWVKLAEISAFFSPDGFKMHILRHLWGDIVLPSIKPGRCLNVDKAFCQALEILQRHGIINVRDESLKIHRLMRESILSSLGGSAHSLGGEIGKSLANYGCMEADGWISLADNLSVLQEMPDVWFFGNFCERLFVANPSFSSICPWEKLNAEDWLSLLKVKPQFANRCPWGKLEELDGSSWFALLEVQPQFIEHCPWEKIDGHSWFALLKKHPQFEEFCPWSKLYGMSLFSTPLREKFDRPREWFPALEWGWLIKQQPVFADRVPWDYLPADDWIWMLIANPDLAARCPWEKLQSLGGEDWARLLIDQPQFAGKCPWEKLRDLDGGTWVNLLAADSCFASYCNWDHLDGYDWVTLLEWRPQFADKCPWEKLQVLPGDCWTELLSLQPQFADKCPWNSLNSYELYLSGRAINWGKLLDAQPQFVDKCPHLNKDVGIVVSLLCHHPQFADKSPWEELDGSAWAMLLRSQPQFYDKCDWSKLDGNDWCNLLEKQPHFADRCDWSKLGGNDWAKLLDNQPQFVDRCPFNKLNAENWCSLLPQYPQMAAHCAWDRFEDNDYADLIRKNIRFANQCDWSKIKDADWQRLLWLLSDQPSFADKCDWSYLYDLPNDFWYQLIMIHPQFANHCPVEKLNGKEVGLLFDHYPSLASGISWDVLDFFSGEDWARFIDDHPSFSDKCQWEKLDGENWSWLLVGRPQLGDKCPWEKLTGKDWADLLVSRSQFADKCDWSKLSDLDWENLLQVQPQFANRRLSARKGR